MSEEITHLTVKDDELTSDIWTRKTDKDMDYNLSLADAINKVAPFFSGRLKKVAYPNKEIFSITLMSSFLESVIEKENGDKSIKAGSIFDKAFSLLGITQRERPKLLMYLDNLMKGNNEDNWYAFLDEIEEEEIDWIAENWFQRGVIHQVQGFADIGKSYFMAEIVAKISSGGQVFGTKVEPRKVMLFSTEDSPTKVIKGRILSLGGREKNLAVITGINMPTLPDGIGQLGDFVAKHRPDMIVLDPILSIYKGNMNDEQQVRDALVPVQQMADFFNVAIVYINHIGKSGKTNPNHKGLGSQGFSAVARSNFEVARDEDTGERYFTNIKNNNGGKALSWAFDIEEHEGFSKPRIKHIGLTDIKAHELGSSEPLKDELKRDILEYISDHELGIEATTLTTYFSNDPRVSQSMRTFEEARAELSKAGKIKKTVLNQDGKNRTYWSIADKFSYLTPNEKL